MIGYFGIRINLLGEEHVISSGVHDDGAGGRAVIGDPLEEEDQSVNGLQSLKLFLVQRINLLNLNTANA